MFCINVCSRGYVVVYLCMSVLTTSVPPVSAHWLHGTKLTSQPEDSSTLHRVPSSGGAGLGPVFSFRIERHSAARWCPDHTKRLHGGGEVGGVNEGVDWTGNSVDDDLHVVKIRAQTQPHLVVTVVGEDPFFLFRNQDEDTSLTHDLTLMIYWCWNET